MTEDTATTITSNFRTGFVSLVGRPNSGKSTLLNGLLGTKLAIVASKPQTTRTAIQGVLTLDNAQIVFLDTPGIHKSDTLLNRRMMEAVRTAVEDRDLLLFLVDSLAPFGEADQQAVDIVKKRRAPAFLLLNKVDRLEDKSRLLRLIEQYKQLHDFAEYLPISAVTGDGLDTLRNLIVERLPEGPAMFPADYLTDQPERFLCCELLREKILRETREEVPHASAVLIEKWEETPKLTRIAATIYVERQGQKGILIGAGGKALKKIGTEARLDIENFLGHKVFLELFVKVRPNWRQDPAFLNELDWHSMAGM